MKLNFFEQKRKMSIAEISALIISVIFSVPTSALPDSKSTKAKHDIIVIDNDGCFTGRSSYPPFLFSDVYRPSDKEKFAKQDGSEINLKISSDHLIAQYVKTKSNPQARLPRGSLVALNFSKETLNKKKELGFTLGSFFDSLMSHAIKSKSLPLTHQSYDGASEKNDHFDIQVLTTNDIYSRMQATETSEASIANGEEAYNVPTSSLIAIDGESRLIAQEDFTFTLPNLPYLNQAARVIQVKKDSYFQVTAYDEKQYEAYTCYKQKDDRLDVKTYYLINFYDADRGFNETQFFINPFEVNFTGNVLPLIEGQVKSVSEVQAKLNRIFSWQPRLEEMIASFGEVNYQGFLRLPTLENEEGDEESLDDHKSYIHYGSEVDPLASDDWGQASTICGIVELSYLWKKLCDQKYSGTGCTLQIGDIAFPVEGFVTRGSGGSRWKKTNRGTKKQKHLKKSAASSNFVASGKDILGHATHYRGTCVDIRPLRKDSDFKPTNIRSKEYDVNKTIDFVKLAMEYGATKRFFNDRRLIKMELTERQPGHDDHIHICFEEKNFCDASSDRDLSQFNFSIKQK
jgi:hypothetical protein